MADQPVTVKPSGLLNNNTKDNPKQRKPRKCSHCKTEGHDKRTCPELSDQEKTRPKKNTAPIVHQSAPTDLGTPQVLPFDYNKTHGGVDVIAGGPNIAQESLHDTPLPAARPASNRQTTATNTNTLKSPSRQLRDDNVIYFAFDLETTGLGHGSDIVEIAIAVLDNRKMRLDGGIILHEFSKPRLPLTCLAPNIH